MKTWKYTDATNRIVVSEDGHTSGLSSALVMEGDTVLPADQPTVADRMAALENAVQADLDADAVAMGFDDIKSAVGYADEPAVKRFQDNGKALRARRSLVWDYCDKVKADVLSGARKEPSAAELVAEVQAAIPPVSRQGQKQ